MRTSPSGDRHRIAIDDDEAALGVDDHAGAVVVALGDARRPRTACRTSTSTSEGASASTSLSPASAKRVVPAAGGGGASPAAAPSACTARARRVVADAVARREPARGPCASRASAARLRVVERGVAQRRRARRPAGSRTARYEVIEVARRGLPPTLGDHRAARHAGRVEHVARVRDEHAAHRRIEMCAPSGTTACGRTASPNSRYSAGVIACRSSTVSCCSTRSPPRSTGHARPCGRRCRRASRRAARSRRSACR